MALDRTVGPRAVSRRDILRYSGGAAVALTSAALLADCGIRLEDSAPRIPLLQRKSVPDEALLIDAVRRLTTLTQLAGRVPKPSDAITALGTLHRTQVEVLRGRLVQAGVPNHVIDGSTPTNSPSAAVSAPASATAADVKAAQSATVTALLGGLPSATNENRTVLASVGAACAAGLDRLGDSVIWPAADPVPAEGAATLLEATRAAAYAFQVIAAQTSGDTRSMALTTHTALDAREQELAAMAGSAAPAAPLGYALPFPVSGPTPATRLAAQVLTTLVTDGLAPLQNVPERSTAVLTLVRFLVGASRLASGWGVAPVPFPGMTYP